MADHICAQHGPFEASDGICPYCASRMQVNRDLLYCPQHGTFEASLGTCPTCSGNMQAKDDPIVRRRGRSRKTCDVFVSYSADDEIVADRIVSLLEKNDIRCWYARRNIKPGANWMDAIMEGIKNCNVFILVVTTQATRSPRIMDELNFAVSQGVTILQFRIEKLNSESAPMLNLSSRQGLDAFDSAWEKHLDQLFELVAASLREIRFEDEEDDMTCLEKPGLEEDRTSLEPTMLLKPKKGSALADSQATEILHLHHHLAECPVSASEKTAGLNPGADKVDCTVFAPPFANPGSNIMVQVFTHTPECQEAVERMAREFDGDAMHRGFRSLEMNIERDMRLTFHLEFPSLEVDEPVQHLMWSGKPESVQFGVTVPPGKKPGNVIGTVTISLASVPVGHIKFILKITPETMSEATPLPLGDHVLAYSKAFISYSTTDRAKVLARVQMLQAVGIEYFQDVLSLTPGIQWETKTYEFIDSCDLFLLFWSAAARDSEWVMKEVRYALKRKGGDDFHSPEIRPVIIEGPPIALPPDDLKHLHFNDSLSYLISIENQAIHSKQGEDGCV